MNTDTHKQSTTQTLTFLTAHANLRVLQLQNHYTI